MADCRQRMYPPFRQPYSTHNNGGESRGRAGKGGGLVRPAAAPQRRRIWGRGGEEGSGEMESGEETSNEGKLRWADANHWLVAEVCRV